MLTKTPKPEKFPVEKSVPIPEIGGRNGRPHKYPWAAMKVGDSFLFPKKMRINVAGGTVTGGARSTGFKFTTRTTPDGVRCWRIK